MNNELVTIVEQAAQARGNPTVSREYIIKALERIECGEEKVVKYPTGAPSLKGIYEIAVKLFKNETKN